MNLKARSERPAHWLDEATIRRVLLALITQAQSDLHRRGLIREDQALAALSLGRSASQVDAITIDEASLGFDSLSRLELISRVNQFFQLSQTGAEDYLLVTPTLGRWVEVVTHHLVLVDTRLSFGFATSGTAGPVRTHVHGIDTLEAELKALCEGPLAKARPGARIVSLVPPHHIYGFLFSCLLPAYLGVPVVDLHRLAPSALARNGRAGDLVIGTPFSWQMVAHAGAALPEGLQGITSAGPSTAETWQRCGDGRPDGMIEIYGATETGGLGSRRAFDAPFDLLPHLVPLPTGIARASDPDVALPVQDRIDWQGSRQFKLNGRLDHIVQVAGVNVEPSLVAERIREVEGVSDVAVRLDGERLKAFVVPASGIKHPQDLEKRIHGHLCRHLPAPARPASVRFGATLPRNEMGKLCDWGVPAPVGRSGSLEIKTSIPLIN